MLNNHKVGSKLTFLDKRWTLTNVNEHEWSIVDDNGFIASHSLTDSGWRKEGNSAVIWDKVKKPSIIVEL